MLNQEWDIKPRSQACSGCQGAFIDQQPYISRLASSSTGYLRQDYCEACWAQEQSAAAAAPAAEAIPSAGWISTWRGVFHTPPAPAAEPLKKETAESLLRGLMEKNDPDHQNTIFVLAVMLERRRLLVERDVQSGPDGSTRRVYEQRQSGDTFLVTDPHLDLHQLERVQAEVMALLDSGLSSGSAPAPSPAMAEDLT